MMMLLPRAGGGLSHLCRVERVMTEIARIIRLILVITEDAGVTSTA